MNESNAVTFVNVEDFAHRYILAAFGVFDAGSPGMLPVTVRSTGDLAGHGPGRRLLSAHKGAFERRGS